MNKADLINFVSEQTNMTKKDSKGALEAVLNGIIEGLETDNKVTLVGFGTFLLSVKKARTAHNPKTGDVVEVPQKTVPKFRPSAALKENFEDVDLNNGDEQEQPEDKGRESEGVDESIEE